MNTLPINTLPEWVEWTRALGPVILGLVTVLATCFSLWVSFRQSKISQEQSRISAGQAAVPASNSRLQVAAHASARHPVPGSS